MNKNTSKQKQNQEKLSKRKKRRASQYIRFSSIDLQAALPALLDKLSRSARFHNEDRCIFLKLFNKLIALCRNHSSLFFSEAWLAKKCGGHWVTMSRLLNDLADLGFIYIQERPKKNGKRQTNLYYINEVLNTQEVQKRLIDFVPAFRCFALKLLFSFGIGMAHSAPLIKLHTTNVKQIERGNNLLLREKVGRGVPETVSDTEGVSTLGVQAREVNRNGSFREISTIFKGIPLQKESKQPMQDEQAPQKWKYKISWWDPHDPFKATNKVSNPYSTAPLPTLEEQQRVTIQDLLLEKEREKYESKRRLNNEEHCRPVSPLPEPERNDSASSTPDAIRQDETQPSTGESNTQYLEFSGEWDEVL